MASPITNKQLKQIAETIREWPPKDKLTWEEICKASALFVGYQPTRQALANKPILINAYKSKKNEIKAELDALSGIPRPKSIPAAMDQILKLKQENKSLKKELTMMAETAQRFIHNASLHGLTRAQLMKPLPNINRKE
jgi:hypothetical protein